jgi:hypothetical protein
MRHSCRGFAPSSLVIALLAMVAACSSAPITGDVGQPGSPDGGPADGGLADGGSDGPVADVGGAADVGSGADGGGGCDAALLHTGLVAQQTGVSVDSFDCQILEQTARYQEPDPMIFKAIIYVESRFDHDAVACPNLPCGMPAGWTADESGCYGLMQIVPACFNDPSTPGLLPDGHPDLAMDMSSPDWTNSVFNPDINVGLGVAGIADNRRQVKQMFPGCTEEQYTLMAVGNYNSYGSTLSCTEYNTDYDNLVLDAYRMYAAAAGYPSRNYP